MKQQNNKLGRRAIVYRVLEAGILLSVVVLIVYGVYGVQDKRRQLAVAAERLAEGPQTVIRQATLERLVADRKHDVDRISAHVLQRESVGDFVGKLEGEAARFDILVQVPTITEEENDDMADPVLDDITVSLRAEGTAGNLLLFLHAVEHLPFLIDVREFNLDTGGGAGSPGFAITVPDRPEDDDSPPVPPANMTATLRVSLSINNDEDSEIK